jgi:hypothetical protein
MSLDQGLGKRRLPVQHTAYLLAGRGGCRFPRRTVAFGFGKAMQSHVLSIAHYVLLYKGIAPPCPCCPQLIAMLVKPVARKVTHEPALS